VNHPEFHQFLLAEQGRRLDGGARRRTALYPRPEPRRVEEADVALRLCTVHDDPALERLAELEGRPLPRGRFVIAEVDGVIVAAQALAGGPPLADPFRPTAHVLPLMRMRIRQIGAGGDGRRFALRRWSYARQL